MNVVVRGRRCRFAFTGFKLHSLLIIVVFLWVLVSYFFSFLAFIIDPQSKTTITFSSVHLSHPEPPLPPLPLPENPKNDDYFLPLSSIRHLGSSVNAVSFSNIDPLLSMTTQELSDNVVDVMICSDSKNYPALVTLISSILRNEKKQRTVFFHLLLPREDMLYVEKWLLYHFYNEITFEMIDFDETLVQDLIVLPEGSKRQELASVYNFARFFIGDLFPYLNRRLVYVDDDCIVQGSVSDLRDVTIEPGKIAAFSTDDLNTLQ
eukprot:Awhi_evm1s5021